MSLGLFAAAVAVRLGALMVLDLHPQRFEYERQALSLLAGEGYRLVHLGTPHLAFGPPPYAFLCAGLYRVFGHGPLPIVLAQIVASSLIPVVIARMAGEVGLERRLRWIAAAPAVVHPGLIVYAVGKLHPLSFDALVLGLTALSVLRLVPAARIGAHVKAGLLVGLATLLRGTVALFPPLAALWLACVAPAGARRRAAAGIVMFLGAAALVVLPWTARNYLVLHRLVFITTDTAELFWRGNNPGATGSALLRDGRAIFAGAPEAFRREMLARDELGQVDLFRQTSRAYLRERPTEFAAGVARKLLSFWWFPVTAGLVYPGAWLAIYRLFYAALLAAAALGAVAAWHRADRVGRQRLVLLLVFLGSVSVAQSLFYVEVRHRWAVEPILGIFVAAAVGRWRPAGTASP
jgi:4-amino-4-deoxy-L-arabinose transferase-like glycosyltransferase